MKNKELEILKGNSTHERVSCLQGLFTNEIFSFDEELVSSIEALCLDKDYGVKFWARKVYNKHIQSQPESAKKEEDVLIPADLPLEILIRKLHDIQSTFVSMEVIKRICDLGDRKAIIPLWEYAKGCTDSIQLSFLTKTLGTTFPSEDMLDRLIPFLSHSDERVIANTLEGIEAINSPRCVVVLSKFLNHPNNRIKGNAAKAFAKYDHKVAYDAISQMLWASNEPHQAISACYAISQLKDERFLPILARLLSNDLTFVDALKAFESVGGKKAEELLEDAFEKAEDEIKKDLLKEALQSVQVKNLPQSALQEEIPAGKIVPIRRAGLS